ncbi:hypothetical protein D3C79_850440 [compost metagenome]
MIAPIIVPTSSAADTASMMLSVSCRVRAATMALKATVAPNERSISAALRTKVMPTAMMAMVAVWRAMFIRLTELRKPLSWSTTEKNTKMPTNTR